MTKGEILKGEGKKIEFKQMLPSGESIAKTAISFSNTAGGKIIIGISDKGEIVGISEEDMLILPDKISNIIYDSCLPTVMPEIYIKNIEGLNVLVVEVFPGALKPYYLKKVGKNNGTYVRVGATNKLADYEMILELERQKRNISFDEECVYDIPTNAVDFENLKRDFKRFTNKELNETDLMNLKIIKLEEGITRVTNAALLLTGHSQLEHSRIKCARFKGNTVGEFIDQKEFNGPLYEQIDNAIKFAKMYIAKKGIISERQRLDEYEIPIVAIKEAITNAVVHRDYSISGSDIKVAIFDDKIEVTSPGQLPKTLDIEEIMEGRSEIRNKIIARFLKEIRLIEEWGTGIRRIVEQCVAMGLKRPEFIETGMHFKVIIHKTKIGSGLVADSGGLVADSSGLEAGNLQSNEEKILKYVENNSHISNKEAVALTGLSPSGVRRIFANMVEEGIISPIGRGPMRRYELVKQR